MKSKETKKRKWSKEKKKRNWGGGCIVILQSEGFLTKGVSPP